MWKRGYGLIIPNLYGASDPLSLASKSFRRNFQKGLVHAGFEFKQLHNLLNRVRTCEHARDMVG